MKVISKEGSRKKSLLSKIIQAIERFFRISHKKPEGEFLGEKLSQYPPHLTLIDVPELAKILGVTESFIYSNISRFPVIRLSRKVLRIRLSDLNTFLDTALTKPKEIDDIVEDLLKGRNKLKGNNL